VISMKPESTEQLKLASRILEEPHISIVDVDRR
jgi:hypothetical protein